MKIFKRVVFVLVSLFFLVECDFSTKKIATDHLKGESTQTYLGGAVQLIYAENTGGMLSLGSNLPDGIRILIFKVFVGIMLFILFTIIILNKNISNWYRLALILFLSGGMGNLIDRIINDGKVVDFIVLRIFDFHTGIFNIADVYVTLGLILLLISNFIVQKKTKSYSLLV